MHHFAFAQDFHLPARNGNHGIHRTRLYPGDEHFYIFNGHVMATTRRSRHPTDGKPDAREGQTQQENKHVLIHADQFKLQAIRLTCHLPGIP